MGRIEGGGRSEPAGARRAREKNAFHEMPRSEQTRSHRLASSYLPVGDQSGNCAWSDEQDRANGETCECHDVRERSEVPQQLHSSSSPQVRPAKPGRRESVLRARRPQSLGRIPVRREPLPMAGEP
jgi:hypothetical protein